MSYPAAGHVVPPWTALYSLCHRRQLDRVFYGVGRVTPHHRGIVWGMPHSTASEHFLWRWKENLSPPLARENFWSYNTVHMSSITYCSDIFMEACMGMSDSCEMAHGALFCSEPCTPAGRCACLAGLTAGLEVLWSQNRSCSTRCVSCCV